MTLRELLDTLKCLGAKITLHDGDLVTIEPPAVITPAVQDALAEHHAARRPRAHGTHGGARARRRHDGAR